MGSLAAQERSLHSSNPSGLASEEIPAPFSLRFIYSIFLQLYLPFFQPLAICLARLSHTPVLLLSRIGSCAPRNLSSPSTSWPGSVAF